MPNRKLPTLAAAAALAVCGTVLAAPEASAHDAIAEVYGCQYQGQFRCGYGGVTNSHTRVHACDTAGDGYGFRTQFLLRSGGGGYVDDANGSSSGCSAKVPGTAANPVSIFRACEKKPVFVCTDWLTA
ncbi:hypothetical protein [Amycolatopsis sp. MEPSY49]|uniref:hypothetical protein n=1 Tax=Amycolatopsis sp. MEPSY49 TaxID=3151600 RepID=UPI003EF769C8